MGYKDDKWREAPGYCVECDNLRPLNRSGVCRGCWEAVPESHTDDWEEDEHHSRWFYQRQQEVGAGTLVRTFIFVTPEGHTFLPGSEAGEPDIENLQVLGFADGSAAEEALEGLVTEHPWIREGGFREVLCYELAAGARESVRELTVR